VIYEIKPHDYLVEVTNYFSKLSRPILKLKGPKSMETLYIPTTQHWTYHNLILNDKHNILPIQKSELPATIGFLDSSYDSIKNYFPCINIFGGFLMPRLKLNFEAMKIFL